MDDHMANFDDDQKTKVPTKREEEEEEALSLCDFPLMNSDVPEKKESCKTRRSSSEPSDFFEFFNHISSDNYIMSHAEDIIFCGKLVPYKNVQPRFHHQILKSLSADDARNSSRRYCESLPDLNPTRSNSITTTRNSRSLDSKRLRCRNSSVLMKPKTSDIHRSFSKSSAKSDGSSSTKVSKPRWFVLMFGPLKLQPEMDLRDMKNRQVRLNPGRMFPGMDAGGKIPAARRSSWGHDLLKVLSCKNHASVAVTASIGLVPHF